MTVRLKIKNGIDFDVRKYAEDAARAVENLVVKHLRKKNRETPPKGGMPKSGYYGDAEEEVSSDVSGKKVEVSVAHPGIALHYFGGTVRPKPGKKALAIPLDPSVADIWPSEDTGDHLALIWPRNSDHGFLKDAETSDLLWLLVPKATIPSDPTVLPPDAEIVSAAESMLMGGFR